MERSQFMEPQIVLSVGDAETAKAVADDLATLYADDFVEPPLKGTEFYSAERFRQMLNEDRAKIPGFTIVTAYDDRELVGFVDGGPLRPATRWWSTLQETLPDDFIRETGSRTFAIFDMVVKRSHRGRKIGSALHSKILEGRREQRVVLCSSPDTPIGYLMWQHYGYRKVGTAVPEGTVLDMLLHDLNQGADTR